MNLLLVYQRLNGASKTQAELKKHESQFLNELEDFVDRINSLTSFQRLGLSPAQILSFLSLVSRERDWARKDRMRFAGMHKALFQGAYRRYCETVLSNPALYDWSMGWISAALPMTHLSDKASLDLANCVIDLLWRSRIKYGEFHLWPTLRIGHGVLENVDLGVPHGLGGVAAFLGELSKRGSQNSRVEKMLEEILEFYEYIITEGSSDSLPEFFPPFNRRQSKMGRKAWCYGSLGVGSVLLRLGHELKKPKVKKLGIRLLDSWVDRRRGTETFLREASLCHGYSGVSYLYHRAHTLTGDRRYLKESEYYLAKSISFLEKMPDFYASRKMIMPIYFSKAGAQLAHGTLVKGLSARWDFLLAQSSPY